MFNREAEALLTLVAVSVFAKHGNCAKDMVLFEKAARLLNEHGLSDPRVTDINLKAWIAFNQLVLRDKIKLGPVGFGIWFELLVDELADFPEKRFVSYRVRAIRKWDAQRQVAETAPKSSLSQPLAVAA